MLRRRPLCPFLRPLRSWWLLFSPVRPGSSSVPSPASSLPPCLAKVGKPSRSKHNALPSGSLQFRALSKEDHGEWECIATNVVTSITASTHLTVIGMGPRQVGGWGSGCWGLWVAVPRQPTWDREPPTGGPNLLWTLGKGDDMGPLLGRSFPDGDRQNVPGNPLTQK